MANDNTLNFELKFKKVCKKISTEKPKNRQEIIDILHANFEDSKIFPDDSIEIQIRHHKFPVWYRLEEPFEIPINGRVKVIILKEKLPINIIQGEIPDIVFTGPFDFTKTVKLRGLPWESDENHIKSFFEGLIIQNDGVYIIYNGDIVKKHSGEAFVEFQDPNSVQKAVLKNRQCILERYVEVQPATKDDIVRYKKKQYELLNNLNTHGNVPRDENSIVLKLMGLPWEASYSDIQNLLIDIPLTAIHFPKDKMCRSIGTAYVEIADEELSARGIGHQREYVGKRFVDIKRVDMSQLIADMSCSDDKDEKFVQDKTFCILMRNLPPVLSNFAIDSFFRSF